MSFVRSSFASLFGGVGQNLINIGFFFALVHSVTPTELGIVTASMIAVEVALVLSRLGSTEVFVRHRNLEPSRERGLFGVVILFSGTLSFALLSAGVILFAAGSPQLGLPLLIAGMCPLIQGSSGLAEGRIIRDGAFQLLSVRQLSASLAACAAGLAWLFVIHDANALPVFRITQVTVGALTSFMASGWRVPKTKISWPSRALLSEALSIVGASFMVNSNQRVIEIVIASSLTSTALGLWRLSIRAAEASIQFVLTPFSMVAYARFTSGDEGTAFENYKRIIRVANVLTVFAFTLLAVNAEAVIYLAAGSSWLGAALIIKIFALLAVPAVINVLTVPLITSLGLAPYMLRGNIIQFLVGTAILVVSVRFGVIGVAVGHVFRSCIYSASLLIIVQRRVPGAWRAAVTASGPALIAACVGILACLAAAYFFQPPNELVSIALNSISFLIGYSLAAVAYPSVRDDSRFIVRGLLIR
ncbi:O-antigen/teichoic acid export membrane protein [Sphingomonas sp. PP-CC-3A-396]|nr:O-antigen/teichoic acid export membrane protein [Sphingomonas sp. PP-CC-3A-396]